MENNSLDAELSQFEDEIWYFHQYARTMQDYRDEISIVWDDNAAVEINGRYLDTHRDDHEKMEENLKDQHQSLMVLNEKFQILMGYFEKVNELSMKIETLINACHEDIAKSYNTMEFSKLKRSEAQLSLNKAVDALSKAKSMM